MRITAISDTHTLHNKITKDLPGGDLLLCAGDISSRGYIQEIKPFLQWFEDQDYHKKVFIAGNHDFGFQNHIETIEELLTNYDVEYLQDDLFLYHPDMDIDHDFSVDYIDYIKIWGSPWQPEFNNWAFNLPRYSSKLEMIWNQIPMYTDILITHGPPWKILDIPGSPHNQEHLGCELLKQRIGVIKPKINIFGHIHGGYGYKFENNTHFINASVLNEQYKYTNKPLTFDWDKSTNELTFIDVHNK